MITETPAARDPEGYLIDPERWDANAAEDLAEEEGLRLDDAYWPVLHFMRSYWAENGVAPDVRHVVDYLIKEHGHDDKKSAKNYLYRLFPYGYVKQACKIAGMQRPRAWSTG